jgi:hypothetical protein
MLVFFHVLRMCSGGCGHVCASTAHVYTFTHAHVCLILLCAYLYTFTHVYTFTHMCLRLHTHMYVLYCSTIGAQTKACTYTYRLCLKHRVCNGNRGLTKSCGREPCFAGPARSVTPWILSAPKWLARVRSPCMLATIPRWGLTSRTTAGLLGRRQWMKMKRPYAPLLCWEELGGISAGWLVCPGSWSRRVRGRFFSCFHIVL